MQAVQQSNLWSRYWYRLTSTLEELSLPPRATDKGKRVLTLEKATASYVQANSITIPYFLSGESRKSLQERRKATDARSGTTTWRATIVMTVLLLGLLNHS